MEPYLLIAKLVEEQGGPLRVAKAMRAPNFQPTLHKYVNGKVLSPKRETAEKIAKHFGLAVDVLYSEKLAKQVYKERFLGKAEAQQEAPPADEQLRESEEVGTQTDWPFGNHITPEQWNNLSDDQRGAIRWEALKALKVVQEALPVPQSRKARKRA